MKSFELGQKLKEMYDNAPTGEKALQIHLFGIKYADEIKENDNSIKDIVNFAGMRESYKTEVGKGVNLAKYVRIKD